MVKVISGNEPYMVDYNTKTTIGAFELPELNFHSFDGYDESVTSFLSSPAFGDERRVALVKVANLKEVDTPSFNSFIASGSNNLLVIQAKDYDARTSFYRKLRGDGMVELCNKDDYEDMLPRFIHSKASQFGAVFEDGVVEDMLQRCSYVDNEEVTISVIAGYVEGMAVLSKHITMETMRSMVPSYEKENRFALAKMIMDRNVPELRKQALLLQGEEIACLSALLREYRIAYKAKYFPYKEIGVSSSILSREDKSYIMRSIDILTDTIRGIKKGTVCMSTCLLSTFIKLIQGDKEYGKHV